MDINRQRVAAVAVAATVAGFGLLYYGLPATEAVAPSAPIASAPTQTITVHIAGAVAKPGLVAVPWSARVADVIAAAGGTSPEADLAAINLAAPVRDGEQVTVPAAGSGGATEPPGDGRVRLNSAAAAELEAIPGIGPVLAGRIIAARDELGGFATVEDLLDVSGIGESKLATIRDLVVVP